MQSFTEIFFFLLKQCLGNRDLLFSITVAFQIIFYTGLNLALNLYHTTKD